jgi:hypothetical protein
LAPVPRNTRSIPWVPGVFQRADELEPLRFDLSNRERETLALELGDGAPGDVGEGVPDHRDTRAPCRLLVWSEVRDMACRPLQRFAGLRLVQGQAVRLDRGALRLDRRARLGELQRKRRQIQRQEYRRRDPTGAAGALACIVRSR